MRLGPARSGLVGAAAVMTLSGGVGTAQTRPPVVREIQEIAALSGEPHTVSAAAVARSEASLLTIENPAPFETSDKRRLVIVGGFDGDERSARAVLNAVRWFKTSAPPAVRQKWSISAIPNAAPEIQRVRRWVVFQAPDLVVDVREDQAAEDSLAPALAADDAGLGPVRVVTARAADSLQAIQKALTSPAGLARSPLHDAIAKRVGRDPLAIARVLAWRYPETPSISYIPAVAWMQTLRLAAITGDESLREKVRLQTRPWLTGEKNLFGDRVQLTAVAGTMIFAELAVAGDSAAGILADRGAALAAAEKAPAVPEYGQGWTDDMFMATSVLAPASAQRRSPGSPGREHDLGSAVRLLIEYAGRLQRSDGLFNHASDGPAAWGRGNGFAALGLATALEALTNMPAPDPSRAKLLDIYRRQMAAVRTHQAPDGTWRQIIDEPGAYREETATAMLMSAMARGVRLGWIDRSYMPTVQRAWRALAAHIADDGAVVDVCAGTGAGPTRRYYLDRPAITGADDRGGAMALLATIEMYELGKTTRPSSPRRAANSSAGRSVR